jgi:hypothetical protein
MKHLLADRRLRRRVTSTVLMGTPANEILQYVNDPRATSSSSAPTVTAWCTDSFSEA